MPHNTFNYVVSITVNIKVFSHLQINQLFVTYTSFCTSILLAPKVTVQVITEHREEFLQKMDATAIALQVQVQGLIPESLKRDIDHSKCREDANGHLLTFLLTGASEIQVQQTLKVASEKMGYEKMSQFAANILQQLQPGQFVAWLVVVSPTLG